MLPLSPVLALRNTKSSGRFPAHSGRSAARTSGLIGIWRFRPVLVWTAVIHFTLKTNPLGEGDLRDFVARFNPENRHDRLETERFKSFTYDELLQRDKVSLDIFWLKDDSLEDSANLHAPEVLAQEIAENLGAALEQFNGIYEALSVK